MNDDYIPFYNDSALDIVDLVIKDFEDRSGFDWWWDEIDDHVKVDILEELHQKVYDYLVERC